MTRGTRAQQRLQLLHLPTAPVVVASIRQSVATARTSTAGDGCAILYSGWERP